MPRERKDYPPFSDEATLAGFEVRPRSTRELYRQIIKSESFGQKRNMVVDFQTFCQLERLTIYPECSEVPEVDVPMIIAPNHYSESEFFTTYQSFLLVVAATLGANELGLTQRNTTWFIKKLPVYPLHPAMLLRRVQNAAPIVYGSIPVEIKKDKIANRAEMLEKYRQAKNRGDNIGFFPEQQPNRTLSSHHPNFLTFLQFLRGFYPECSQILPASVFFEDTKNIRVKFGQIVKLDQHQDHQQIAHLTMRTIASNLPNHLRGNWQ